MKDFNRLKYIVALALLSSTSISAQDLKLECQGAITYASSIGSSKEWKVEVYEFKGGKLYGWVPAVWSNQQINVTFPMQKSSLENVEKFTRTIVIDRDKGSVMDYTKMWRSDIPIVENLPNYIANYDGQCRKFFKKF